MKKVAPALSFAAVALASPEAHVAMFEEFVQTYRREYTSEEKDRRLEIFKANMQMIEETNAKKLSYTLGVTPYTDLTFEEFRAQFIGGVTPWTAEQKESMTTFEKTEDAPDSIDWVEKGAVTPVKNQGHCGSCWTFSATGALEGAMVAAGRKLTPLSEQELVDCDTGMLGGHGCKGGNPAQAFGWVKSNGICGEDSYPYVCMNMTADSCVSSSCATSKCSNPVLAGGSWIKSGDVTAYGMVSQTVGDLEAAVARQPISIAIEADQPVFQHYTSGVLTDDACGQKLDHGVLIVGYGVEKGLFGSTEYWKVKNSWGDSWGDKGFIRIARGKSAGYGECGVREMASYPTVKPASEVVV